MQRISGGFTPKGNASGINVVFATDGAFFGTSTTSYILANSSSYGVSGDSSLSFDSSRVARTGIETAPASISGSVYITY
jgi:phage gp45-like